MAKRVILFTVSVWLVQFGTSLAYSIRDRRICKDFFAKKKHTVKMINNCSVLCNVTTKKLAFLVRAYVLGHSPSHWCHLSPWSSQLSRKNGTLRWKKNLKTQVIHKKPLRINVIHSVSHEKNKADRLICNFVIKQWNYIWLICINNWQLKSSVLSPYQNQFLNNEFLKF